MTKPKVVPTFEECIAWHQRAAHLSVEAPSYVKTQVIVAELDEAIRLLRLAQEEMPITTLDAFLEKHKGAPYHG